MTSSCPDESLVVELEEDEPPKLEILLRRSAESLW